MPGKGHKRIISMLFMRAGLLSSFSSQAVSLLTFFVVSSLHLFWYHDSWTYIILS